MANSPKTDPDARFYAPPVHPFDCSASFLAHPLTTLTTRPPHRYIVHVLQAFRIHSFNVHGRGFVRIVIYNAGTAQTLAAILDLYIKLADDCISMGQLCFRYIYDLSYCTNKPRIYYFTNIFATESQPCHISSTTPIQASGNS